MPHYPLRVIVRPYLNAGAGPAALKLPIFLGLHIFTSRVFAIIQITKAGEPHSIKGAFLN